MVDEIIENLSDAVTAALDMTAYVYLLYWGLEFLPIEQNPYWCVQRNKWNGYSITDHELSTSEQDTIRYLFHNESKYHWLRMNMRETEITLMSSFIQSNIETLRTSANENDIIEFVSTLPSYQMLLDVESSLGHIENILGSPGFIRPIAQNGSAPSGYPAMMYNTPSLPSYMVPVLKEMLE
jgi:hypothetical protein